MSQVVSWVRFVFSSGLVGAISLLIVLGLRYVLHRMGFNSSITVLISNSAAYSLGALLSYISQAIFVHADGKISLRGLAIFGLGQIIISLILGGCSAWLEVGMESFLINRYLRALLALSIALVMMMPLSYLFGRYCVTR